MKKFLLSSYQDGLSRRWMGSVYEAIQELGTWAWRVGSCLGLLGISVEAATIEGRISLPKVRVAPVINQRYEIIATGGVLGTNPPLAVVYLEGKFAGAATPAVVQMIQREMAFVPALLPVRIGTKVEFPNLDPGFHNIFSFSLAKRFDLGRYRSDEKPVPSQVFDALGLVTLRCDIHEHMRALVLVLDTPYFTITDEEGSFRLIDLPAGGYTLKVWLDSKTMRERPVVLVRDAALRMDFP